MTIFRVTYFIFFYYLGLATSCSEKEKNPEPKVLGQNKYKGIYLIIRTELSGFDATMSPITKTDTLYHQTLVIDYVLREDSILISSEVFLYSFAKDGSGEKGSTQNYTSTFTNAGTHFIKTDSSLIIDGHAQQGSRIQTTREFNGVRL